MPEARGNLGEGKLLGSAGLATLLPQLLTPGRCLLQGLQPAFKMHLLQEVSQSDELMHK
jgi:hypothetical protein